MSKMMDTVFGKSNMCLFLQFKQMDKDKTGTIDWWEFLNHEALKRIAANRSKVSHL